MEEVKPGLHERLVTRDIERLIPAIETGSRRADYGELDDETVSRVVARHLHDALCRFFGSLPAKERVEQSIRIANQIVDSLKRESDGRSVDADDAIVAARLLLAIVERRAGALTTGEPPERPSIPLSTTDLLVNARGEPSIGSEIAREIDSADRVDLLCSFLKWTGFRLVEQALRTHRERGRPLRVLTTTYCGVTEARVLDALADLGAEVRVSYETRRTRLHAKAWLFHRESGYHTALIGSSNLSHSALVDGLEWNVRVSIVDARNVLEKFRGTFEGYFADGEFEPYDRGRFLDAIRGETKDADGNGSRACFAALDVRPYPFQQEILDQLDAERTVHARFRNLVVAATGTGKTVVAAFDFRRIKTEHRESRLLFVAHREEILQQSLATFRAVLNEAGFGELLVGGRQPREGRHVFASIQSLSRIDLAALDPVWFDVVIVDEFHHAAAPTYERLLAHLQPRILLGLTATPERADGVDVTRRWFGGHVASELRLWSALDRGLLCPFQYFGIADDVDLRTVGWRRGRYDEKELDRIYTGDDARALLVAREVQAKVGDPSRMKALAFCVSVAHAEYMTRKFATFGYRAETVTGDVAPDRRSEIVQRLRRGELQVIFTVDVFNEGVDIPEIDTILLLRPTQSATVFQQQLGRGLRHSDGKSCVTVLDFIGQVRREFRFDLVLRAFVAGSRAEIERQVVGDFPFLPPGCAVRLERKAKEIVLESLRASISGRRSRLVSELRSFGRDVSLAEFLAETGIELADIYSGIDRSWTELRRAADLPTGAPGELEKALLRGVRNLLHLDDLERITELSKWLADTSAVASSTRQRLRTMLHHDLWPGAGDRPADLEESRRLLLENPAVVTELGELLAILRDRISHVPVPFSELPTVPLLIHCRYRRDEITTAFGLGTPAKALELREGVLFERTTNTDLLFVTLEKSERDYSPETMYRDYAIGLDVFHWESQHTTREDSASGRRYRNGSSRVLLFVRERKKAPDGRTEPYMFLGPASYVSHEGERPMQIRWRLKHPMPAALFREAQRVAG